MRLPRWLLWTAAALVLIVAIGAAVVAHLTDQRRLRAELETRLSAALGLPVAVRGPIVWKVGPPLHVELANLVVGEAAAPVLAAGRVQLDVELAALLERRIAIGAVRVERPVVRLAVDRAGRGNWEGRASAAPAPSPSAAADEPPMAWTIASLAIVDGALEYGDQRSGAAYAARELALETGRIALPEPVDLKLAAQLASGTRDYGRATLAARVTADTARSTLAVDGLTVAALGLAVSGAARVEREANSAVNATATLATAPFAPRAVLATLGIAAPPMRGPDALGAAEFAAKLRYAANALALDDVAIRLDDTRITGTIAADLAPRAYRLALAADRIVADRYLKPANPRERTPVVLPLEFLQGLPVSGELRIGELVLGASRLRDVRIDLGNEAGRP